MLNTRSLLAKDGHVETTEKTIKILNGEETKIIFDSEPTYQSPRGYYLVIMDKFTDGEEDEDNYSKTFSIPTNKARFICETILKDLDKNERDKPLFELIKSRKKKKR